MKTGGPAFPQTETITSGGESITKSITPGMSLRAYIATEAMAALIACPYETQEGQESRRNADMAALWAIQYADALITKLEEVTP